MKEKIKKISRVFILMSVGVVVLAVGIFYGLFYIDANKRFNESRQLIEVEKYTEAIDELEFASEAWNIKNLGIKKQEISDELEKAKQLLNDKLEYAQGVEYFNKENWEEAKELLSRVSEVSPYYQEAKNKTEEAQNNIVKEQISEAVGKVTRKTEAAQKAAQKRTTELKQKISELETKKQTQSDLPSLINYWKPRIAYINCTFKDRFGKTELIKSGSGLLFSLSDFPTVITNKHIIVNNNYSANYCSVLINGDYYTVNDNAIWEDKRGYDLGFIDIKNPTNRTKAIVLSYKEGEFCDAKSGNTGDEIIVLGYPVIGVENNITATEGIISGYENYYYITSAKIEQGNSGGGAILLKSNCYLGIPTYVIVGQIESLGRILDFTEVLFNR